MTERMDCPPLYGEPSGASDAAGAAEEVLVLVEARVEVFVLEEDRLVEVFVLEEDRLVLLEVLLVEVELLLGADVTETARVVVEVACLLTKTCAELQPKSAPVVWLSKIAFMIKGYTCYFFE